ncbi:unnamed protein product [Ectocarpus sp. 4 AP-2014]
MDLSIDDLLEEVEGALEEGSCPRRSSKGDRHQPPCAATECCPLFLCEDPPEPLGSSQHAPATARQRSEQGITATAAPAMTPPQPLTAHQASFSVMDIDDLDSELSPVQEPVPGAATAAAAAAAAAAATVDRDVDPISPGTQGTRDSVPRPLPAAVPGPSAGVDFDSDSSPVGTTPISFAADNTARDDCDLGLPAVTTAPAAVGDGVDSDSSQAQAAVASAVGVDFDEDSQDGADYSLGLVLSAAPEQVQERTSGINSGLTTPYSNGNDDCCVNDEVTLEWPQRHRAEAERRPASAEKASEQTAATTMVTPSAVPGEGRGGGGTAAAVAAVAAPPTKKRRRCGTVFVGGMATDRGFCASSLSQRACDKLRCTDCNFEVLCFHGRAWDDQTDYMFLRNNVPDTNKLSARLTPCPDSCAYACQCSWKNVKDVRAQSPTERPRWACGGH